MGSGVLGVRPRAWIYWEKHLSTATVTNAWAPGDSHECITASCHLSHTANKPDHNRQNKHPNLSRPITGPLTTEYHYEVSEDQLADSTHYVWYKSINPTVTTLSICYMGTVS